MKTSNNELLVARQRMSQMRSSLYLIAHGKLSEESARREAARALALDDKMKEDTDGE